MGKSETLSVAALLLLLVATPAPALAKMMMAEPDPPAEAAFAFSNEAGTHLLAVGEVVDPERMTTALCAGGARHAVVFEKMQAEGATDTGRAVASNFDDTAGARYRIEGAPIPLGEDDFLGVTCLLAAKPFLEGSTVSAPTAVSKKKRGCNAAHRRAIAAAKGRKVTRCLVLLVVGKDPILMAELAPKGKNLLATLVVPSGEGFAFLDYEATRDPAGTSCWRVDDGCRFPTDSLRILVAVTTPAGLHLAIAWGAFEGENATLVRAAGDKLLEVVAAYRYWAPM